MDEERDLSYVFSYCSWIKEDEDVDEVLLDEDAAEGDIGRRSDNDDA